MPSGKGKASKSTMEVRQTPREGSLTLAVFKLAPNAAAKELAVEFYRYLSSQDGNFVPNPVRLMPGGLDKIVPDGFALLGSNMVSARDEGPARTEAHMKPISGEKLVYVIEEE